MPIAPKIAGIASVVSSINDIHKTAMIYSDQEKNKAMGDTLIACSIGNQKADYISYKDAQRKNWANKNNFFSGVNEFTSSLKGYFRGVAEGVTRYFPKFILAALAIIPKSTKGKSTVGMKTSYISAIALAGYEIWDFLANGTGLCEKTDYLKRK